MLSLLRIVHPAGSRSYGGWKFKPGWSLDLTVDDPEIWQPLDLLNGKIRSKVSEFINNDKPYMIICSPMCTAFARIQNINKNRRIAEVI